MSRDGLCDILQRTPVRRKELILQMSKQNGGIEKEKSMESWIWDAACSLRGAADAPKFKDFILPLIFFKRLCDVSDDEKDGARSGWDVVRGKTGEQLTYILRSAADE